MCGSQLFLSFSHCLVSGCHIFISHSLVSHAYNQSLLSLLSLSRALTPATSHPAGSIILLSIYTPTKLRKKYTLWMDMNRRNGFIVGKFVISWHHTATLTPGPGLAVLSEAKDSYIRAQRISFPMTNHRLTWATSNRKWKFSLLERLVSSFVCYIIALHLRRHFVDSSASICSLGDSLNWKRNFKATDRWFTHQVDETEATMRVICARRTYRRSLIKFTCRLGSPKFTQSHHFMLRAHSSQALNAKTHSCLCNSATQWLAQKDFPFTFLFA